MHRLFRRTLAVALLALPQAAHSQTVPAPRLAAAATAIAAAHAAGNFDGAVVFAQSGNVLLGQATGEADRVAHTPNRTDTVFRLASLTKQVTALLVMQQVASGRIALDQKAGDLLPALPTSAALVTVRQLLQHFSGLPNPSDGPDNIVPAFYQRTAATTAELSSGSLAFCTGTPKRAPGLTFEYNNCDYIVLGAILEHLTGQPYDRLVQTRIIQPLGLSSWGIFPSTPAARPHIALGYGADGALELPQNPATYGPAGALFGNALDVARWNDALLQHKLLSAGATEIMFHADPKLYGEALGSWSYTLPGISPPISLVERQGEIGGTRLLSILVPTQNASLVIIANTERADLFNTYSRKGLGYAILQAAFAP